MHEEPRSCPACVRNLAPAANAQAGFLAALAAMQDKVRAWRTADMRQTQAVAALDADLATLERKTAGLTHGAALPWDALYRFAEANLSLEGQEANVALILEPHGELIDDLAETMAADEDARFRIDSHELRRSEGADRAGLRLGAALHDFSQEQANARFWYVSAEKLEPRLRRSRSSEPGAERRKQPLAGRARRRSAFPRACGGARSARRAPISFCAIPNGVTSSGARRIAARHPYAEIRDNLIDAGMRPIDLLRSKLAFFGSVVLTRDRTVGCAFRFLPASRSRKRSRGKAKRIS